MTTHNLSGSAKGNNIARKHPLECFLRPFSEGKTRFVDAQIHPETVIEDGDEVFFMASQSGHYIMERVSKTIERRKAAGEWECINPHMDWIRLQLA